jgi:hypothetical protein
MNAAIAQGEEEKDEGGRMRDERTCVANCFLPILPILPYGGLPVPEEYKPMFSLRIPVHQLLLTIRTIPLIVVRS